MPYLLLAGFWTGILVLEIKPVNLKDRAKSLYERVLQGSKESRVTLAINKIRMKYQKEKQTKELFACLSYIRNVAILGKNKSVSALTLLDGLIDISVLLRPAFQKMARLISVNNKTEASLALGELMGGGIASDVGAFLASWEDIDPNDILQTIEAYQSAIREEMATALRTKDELLSDIIYLPVVVNSMLVLLNFIYVAYFVPQQEALSFIF